MVLVSDGGGLMAPEEEPKTDWARHALRITGLLDHQVRSLRKRQVVHSFTLARGQSGEWRHGTYWSIRGQVAEYGLADAVPADPAKTFVLANLQTRLKRLDRSTQERLVNWGYIICDAAIRKWVLPGTQKPAALPFPNAGIG